jgi:transposase-like protein
VAGGRDLHKGERPLDLLVSGGGQTIDFLLAARCDTAPPKRFFRKTLAQPRTITVDKNPAYPKAFVELKDDGEPSRRSRLRQAKYPNNMVEQDHRRTVIPNLILLDSWCITGRALNMNN